MRILFFGTPQFAASVLQDLLDHGVNICAVVTKPDQPKGRSGTPLPPPVKVVAEAHGLPVHQPDRCSTAEVEAILAGYQADLFLVVAYGEIIRQNILDLPPKGCINIHGSILPKYRGAAPIQRAIMRGETESGVTIIYMARKMDAGAIIATATTPIGENMTAGELELRLRELGSTTIRKVLTALEKGDLKAAPQDESQVTFAPKIELEDCEIDWTGSAQDLHNLIRGVNPFPGAWCYVMVRGQKKRMKLWRSQIEESSSKGAAGQILTYDFEKGIVLQCGIGSLRLVEIQPEGKKAMAATEFVKGLDQAHLLFTTEAIKAT